MYTHAAFPLLNLNLKIYQSLSEIIKFSDSKASMSNILLWMTCHNHTFTYLSIWVKSMINKFKRWTPTFEIWSNMIVLNSNLNLIISLLKIIFISNLKNQELFPFQKHQCTVIIRFKCQSHSDCKVKPLTFNKNVDPAVNKNYKILTRVLQKLPQSNMQRIERLEHPLHMNFIS